MVLASHPIVVSFDQKKQINQKKPRMLKLNQSRRRLSHVGACRRRVQRTSRRRPRLKMSALSSWRGTSGQRRRPVRHFGLVGQLIRARPAPKVETPILQGPTTGEEYRAGPGARKEQTPTTSAGERETQRIMASSRAMELERVLRQMLSIQASKPQMAFLPLLHPSPLRQRF
jgi:hypothetical protein